MASSFVPRLSFPITDSIPRSFFLGHHRAGLSAMQKMLSTIDIVIECRDYRLPLTSRNPLLEESLAGRTRAIVYTKRDLGSHNTEIDRERERTIRKWHNHEVFFCNHQNKNDVKRILDFGKSWTASRASLTGSCMLVVGMPNVGKSSLLNALRRVGVGKGKAAPTGDQPGVTRKVGTAVKIAEGEDNGEGLYLADTPGVFVPYVSDGESMLKLALCGCVRDGIVPYTTLADYLLYRLNMISPTEYCSFHEPTNDVMELLNAIAVKTGRLRKGGQGDLEAAAVWFIQRWRAGQLGRFVLDEVTDDAWRRAQELVREAPVSLNQGRKAVKADRQARQSRRDTQDA